MDGETIISFNATNTITVLIMVALGFTALGFGVKLWQQRKSATTS